MNNEQQGQGQGQGQGSQKGSQVPPMGNDKNLKGKKSGDMDQKEGGDACASKGGSCGSGMSSDDED